MFVGPSEDSSSDVFSSIGGSVHTFKMFSSGADAPSGVQGSSRGFALNL